MPARWIGPTGLLLSAPHDHRTDGASLRRAPVSDRAAVVLALAVALGAWWSAGVPLLLGPVVVAAALAGRRPVLVCLGGLLLASALGHRAWAGLGPPAPERVSARIVTLVSDPVEDLDEVRAIVRLDGRRLEIEVPQERASPQLVSALAGERASQIAQAPRDILLRTKAKMQRRAGIEPGATLDL